jgi:Chaperone of endosialidase
MKSYNFWNPAWLCANVFTLYGGGKSDAPAAPDYAAAAKETAQGNLDAARVAAKANRVSQYTPYGNLVYTQEQGGGFDQAGYDAAMKNYQSQLANYRPSSGSGGFMGGGGFVTGSGLSGIGGNIGRAGQSRAPIAPDRNAFMIGGDPDVWRATQTLSPAEQSKLDKNNQLSLGLLDTAQLGLSGVNEALSKGFNWDALPKSQVDAGQTAQDAIMARINPQFATREDALRTRLINQGVRPGTEAWDNEFKNFGQDRNDATSQAALYGIDVGNKARQQALQEQEFGRTEGLNMVNALRTGNQVQQPNFVNTPQQATTAGADLLGAANAQYQGQLGAYNAEQAGSNGFLGGLGSLAGAGAQFWKASDERLKTNIRQVGKHKTGVGIYSYIKNGLHEIGVIAQHVQKVLPNAVRVGSNGYLEVNYAELV